ncbi:MAG: CPBP family intramembrane glutamic endopeptidase [Anaerolineae bacterium]
MLILLLPVLGPGGEEPFGWRGYALLKLQEKWGQWGPLIASLIIGTAWGVWHLPEFYNPASTQYALGIGFLGPMIISWIAHSIVMAWLYNKTGSVLLGGVIYHLTLDTSSTFLVDFTLTGMFRGEQVGSPADLRLLTLQIVVSALVALILVIATRGRLGYSAKNEAEA